MTTTNLSSSMDIVDDGGMGGTSHPGRGPRRPRNLDDREGRHPACRPRRDPLPLPAHARTVADQRSATLAAARLANPERFSTSRDPKILELPDNAWINQPAETPAAEHPMASTTLTNSVAPGEPGTIVSLVSRRSLRDLLYAADD
jgi:hypothetical protein